MPVEATELARLFKVLAHPIRLRIVCFLYETPANVNVKRLWTSLELPQAIVSQQLAVLKRHGLIRGLRRGPSVHYQLADERLQRLLGALFS